MENTPDKNLAKRLDELPNSFPPSEDGLKLDLRAKLFSPGEAELASGLRLTREVPEQSATRLGREAGEFAQCLKALLAVGRSEWNNHLVGIVYR